MSNEAQPARVSLFPSDRRRFARRGVKSLSYIDLGNATGGIVLNISEGGLAVHSAVALTPRDLPVIRFQLPDSPDWVSAGGAIAWLDRSRKEAGIRFDTVPDGARSRIRGWIASPADDSLRGSSTIGGMQLTSLKLGRIPPAHENVHEAKPREIPHEIDRPYEIETVDRKLRLHFANRDAAPVRPTRGLGIWWTFTLAIGVLAILSFGFGWMAGHGQSDDLASVVARISGRTVAHAENTSRSTPVVQAASSASSAPQNALATGASSASLPRITFTTRDYVPVPEESNDASNGALGNAKSSPAKVYELLMGKLAHRVDPAYPEQALSQHLEGTVQLRATISAAGQVDSVSVVSGDPTLASAAEDAVRQWRYAPTLLDGNPVPTEQAITLVFSLPSEQ